MRIQQTTPTNPNFQRGMTQNFSREIANCDVAKVSQEFFKYNIPTMFKGNKAFAWCALKSLQYIKNINSRYNLNLQLPGAIMVENFDNLDFRHSEYSLGICTLSPAKLYKNSNVIIPQNTLIFNDNVGNTGENIDFFADAFYETDDQPDDFFLIPVLHEFAHAMHVHNIISKLGLQGLVKLIYASRGIVLSPKNAAAITDRLCSYAKNNPFETIACDLSKRFIDNMNEKTLEATANPLKNSPYQPASIFDLFKIKSSQKRRVDNLVRKFWNGEF